MYPNVRPRFGSSTMYQHPRYRNECLRKWTLLTKVGQYHACRHSFLAAFSMWCTNVIKSARRNFTPRSTLRVVGMDPPRKVHRFHVGLDYSTTDTPLYSPPSLHQCHLHECMTCPTAGSSLQGSIPPLFALLCHTITSPWQHLWPPESRNLVTAMHAAGI
jgi:hypothetical protein